MIIGLNGRLKAGKDTTFGVIKEFIPEAEQVSFARMLKMSAAASIGIDVETLEAFKGREDLFYELVDLNPPGDVYRFNIRQYLQWYGTEGHRHVFGDDFWVDMALPAKLDHSDRVLVVTDMRFPNEAQRVIDLGGITVKVERETVTNHAAHVSEQNIDHMIQYFLDNRGTMTDLRANVAQMLLEIGADTGDPTLMEGMLEDVNTG
jgi:hypothetical protein